jgi:hypothetical protein
LPRPEISRHLAFYQDARTQYASIIEPTYPNIGLATVLKPRWRLF